MKYWMQEMRWREVEEAIQKNGGVVLVPVGSTEQHGYHLPLGTDSYCAIGLAEDVAKQTGALIAPPLWMGWSPHHMAITGTISIRSEILVEFVADELRSLATHGFKKIVIINGHRIANLSPLTEAAWKAKSETGAEVLIVDPAFMGQEAARELDIAEYSHGDQFETSHMLYLHPELVAMEKAVAYHPPKRRFFISDPREKGDRLHIGGTFASLEQMRKMKEISGGTTGDPSRSTRETGEKLHRAIVENIVSLIKDLKKA